jgi:hypothetical protein
VATDSVHIHGQISKQISRSQAAFKTIFKVTAKNKLPVKGGLEQTGCDFIEACRNSTFPDKKGSQKL